MCTSSKALTHKHTHTSHLLYLLDHEGVFIQINMRILTFELFMACDSSLFELNLILINSFKGTKSNYFSL